MSDWKKIVRVKHGPHEVDMLDKHYVIDGTKFNVRFPDGSTQVLSAIVRRHTLLIDSVPFVQVQEGVFFPVKHAGLPIVWVRAIDVDVQEV